MVYGREIDGTVTTFGTTGYTNNRVFLLYDRLTHTVWYPLGDGAFDGVGGEKLGSKIPYIEKPPRLPLSEWIAMHPGTSVLLDDAAALEKEDETDGGADVVVAEEGPAAQGADEAASARGATGHSS